MATALKITIEELNNGTIPRHNIIRFLVDKGKDFRKELRSKSDDELTDMAKGFLSEAAAPAEKPATGKKNGSQKRGKRAEKPAEKSTPQEGEGVSLEQLVGVIETLSGQQSANDKRIGALETQVETLTAEVFELATDVASLTGAPPPEQPKKGKAPTAAKSSRPKRGSRAAAKQKNESTQDYAGEDAQGDGGRWPGEAQGSPWPGPDGITDEDLKTLNVPDDISHLTLEELKDTCKSHFALNIDHMETLDEAYAEIDEYLEAFGNPK